jgi:hypothetical protein
MTIQGLGGLGPKPMTAPEPGAVDYGIPAGYQGSFIGSLVVIYSTNPGSGLFVYQGKPGPGTLIMSVTAATEDPYGNKTRPFAAVSYGGDFASALSSGGLIWFEGSLSAGWSPWIEFEIPVPGALSLFSATAAALTTFIVGGASGTVQWVFPSGDTTGATDWTNITNAMADTGIPTIIYLAGGQFWVNQPLVISPWVFLIGQSNIVDNSALSDNGTTISATATFTNTGAPAGGAWPESSVILMVDQATGEYEELSAGQYLFGVNVDASAAPTGTHGITLYNAVYGVSIANFTVQQAPGTGLFGAFATSQVDGLHVYHGLLSRCGRGVDLNIADGVFEDVNATGSLTDDNWHIRNAVDTIFNNCRGGNAAVHNWNFAVNQTITGGYCLLQGCGSDLSGSYGVLINYGNTGGIWLNFVGFASDQDNAGAATGAIRISSAPQPVLFDGVTINTTADFGIQYANAANLCVASGIIEAATSPFSNGGGNGVVQINYDSIITFTGWNYVGSAGNPAFGSGWSNVGSGNADLAFKFITSNEVWIKGYVKNSTAANTANIFVLPSEYVPASQQIFTSVENGTVYGNSVVVQTTGDVVMFAAAGAGNYAVECRVALDI